MKKRDFLKAGAGAAALWLHFPPQRSSPVRPTTGRWPPAGRAAR